MASDSDIQACDRTCLNAKLERTQEELQQVRRECRAHYDSYTFLRASLEKLLIEAEVMRKDLGCQHVDS